MKRNGKKRKRIIIYSSLGVLVVVMLLVKMGVFKSDKGLSVSYCYPERRTVVQSVAANGRIQPVLELKISPEVSGEITELPIIEGQRVQQGALLCRIKPDTYVSMCERAQASLNSAQVRRAQANDRFAQTKKSFARSEQLFREKAISDAEFETAQTEYQVARNESQAAQFSVESAQASLREAQENLRKTTIYAPMDATISRLAVELGERVVGTAQMAGTELMRLADLTRMEARVVVSESDIVNVSLSDTAVVYVDAYPDTTFRGVVTQIANSAVEARSVDQVTSFEVRILLLEESYQYLIDDQHASPFKPGMSVNVDIRTRREDNALTLPLEAITTRADDSGDPAKIKSLEQGQEPFEAIFLAVGDTAKMVRVTTGIQDATHIVIKSELSDSAQVIVSPYSTLARTLSDGAKISASKQY